MNYPSVDDITVFITLLENNFDATIKINKRKTEALKGFK